MRTSIKNIIILAVILLHIGTATAQQIRYSVETTGAFANNDTPTTWHLSNRQGLSSEMAKFGYMRAGLSGSHAFENRNITLNWVADVVAGDNLTSTLYIQQAFADINWKMLTLSLGQKERWGELKNHRLSTGALTESGNARPIPQIRIEAPEYFDLFGTNGWFTVRGHLAYGWFTDGEWQKDWVASGKAYSKGVRYHSKAGFFKIGKEERFPFVYEFGLQMVAQFGGTMYNVLNNPGDYLHNPSRIKDYLMIFIPSSGDSQYSDFDKANVAGNHLGSWHSAISWNQNRWKLRAYYEHLFDDHSQMFMEYGLWTEQLVGLELTLKDCRWVKGIAIEYYNLKKQGGPVYHDTNNVIPDQVSCRDDNYNHQRYNGWFNYGMIIGSPMATSPIYNEEHILNCYNNRAEAFHIGVEGEPFNSFGYRVLLTHSNNWGTYKNPFTDIKSNTAGLVEVTFKPQKLNGWSLTASYAFDNGTLLGNNRSAMLTISNSGIINLKNKKR